MYTMKKTSNAKVNNKSLANSQDSQDRFQLSCLGGWYYQKDKFVDLLGGEAINF